MNYFKVQSALIAGVQAIPLQVECAQSRRLPYLQIIGGSGKAVAELRERVVAALDSSRLRLPARRITVQIQPGAHGLPLENVDLAVALAILGGSGVFPAARLERLLVSGGLGLDGSLQPLCGVPALRRLLVSGGYRGALLPWQGSEILSSGDSGGGFAMLAEAVEYLQDRRPAQVRSEQAQSEELEPPAPARIWARIEGQRVAKRVLEVAAAGGHHVLFPGPRAARADLLAHALSTLLPPLEPAAAEEVGAIYSLAGLSSWPSRPFFRFGSAKSLPPLIQDRRLAKLEELLLAHRGVLFVDRICDHEPVLFPELLEPMLEGKLRARLGRRSWEIPLDPLVVGATPACACGASGDASLACTCRPTEARRFQARWRRLLHYPFDLFLSLNAENGAAGDSEESPEARADRAQAARGRMMERQGRCNARLQEGEVFEVKPWKGGAGGLWKVLGARRSGGRGEGLPLARVALTLSDLRGAAEVEERDLFEARHYVPEEGAGGPGRNAASSSLPDTNSMAIP